jgi:hypothetical protein
VACRLPGWTKTLAISAVSAVLAGSTTYGRGDAPPDLPDSTFQTILQCLSLGHEIVMAPAVDCVARQMGGAIAARAGMPLVERDWSGDWDSVCRDANDSRRLPSNIVKRIAAQKEVTIAPSGIRIVGAVFCGGPQAAALDLVGLDLNYSLVIDRSVINGFLDARNMRIKGDFSFENTVIVENLRLNRARVEGSVYANKSFMDALFVNDTQVNGTWWHQESIIFSDAHMVRANVSGDLNMSKSAFNRLWIQSSQIAGTLSLDNSEARCAYHLHANTVGYLAANQAGFGIVKTATSADQAPIDYSWWNRAVSGSPKPYTQQMMESPAIRRIADAALVAVRGSGANPVSGAANRTNPPLVRGCEDTSGSAHLEFYVFDTNVQAAFCLTSFVWMAPKSALPDIAHPTSIVALNGTKINGNLIVDLWADESSVVGKLKKEDKNYRLVRAKHKFEAIGVSTAALISDFSDNSRPYFIYVDGLKFDRVHKAKPACTNASGAKLASQVELPSTDDVLRWLEKNEAPSSQPFMAFVAAFEQAGTSATPLRVKQKTIDLCEKTARWFPFVASQCPGERFSSDSLAATTPGRSQQTGAVAAMGEIFSNTGELVMIAYQWTLFLLADHGMRPAKVVWSVGIALLAFLAWFWYVLGIVGFEPKPEGNALPGQPPALWPVTFLFLFDRMIPAYKIREEHYAITRVYRIATAAEIKAGPLQPGAPPYPIRYLGKTLLVWPAGDVDLEKVEKWLVVLRVIGVVFTIFLLAAINALASG